MSDWQRVLRQGACPVCERLACPRQDEIGPQFRQWQQNEGTYQRPGMWQKQTGIIAGQSAKDQQVHIEATTFIATREASPARLTAVAGLQFLAVGQQGQRRLLRLPNHGTIQKRPRPRQTIKRRRLVYRRNRDIVNGLIQVLNSGLQGGLTVSQVGSQTKGHWLPCGRWAGQFSHIARLRHARAAYVGILSRYTWKTVGTYLLVALIVGTFVMLIGQMAKVFDLLAKGVSFMTLLGLVLHRVPQVLGFTLPLSLFIATVIHFNQLSNEHELSALRSAGISLFQIAAPVMLLAVILSGFCTYLQFWVIPHHNAQARWKAKSEAIKNPLDLLVENQFIEIFDGYMVYVGEKKEDEVHDIHVVVLDNAGSAQKFDAARGEVLVDERAKKIELLLYDATIQQPDPENPFDASNTRRLQAGECRFPLYYGDVLDTKRLVEGTGRMRTGQLFANIALYKEKGMDPTSLMVEIQLRAALALAPFSLILLAIPLSVKHTRRDNTKSLFLCIVTPMLYFALISFVQSQEENTALHPEILVWVPNLLCQGLGLIGLWQKR